MAETTNKLSEDTNPLVTNVIYRGSVAVNVNSVIAMGFSGTASVDLREVIDVPIMNPVVFMYEYELFAAASHTLTPVPYSLFDTSGTLTRSASFNLYNLADGTMNLNVGVKSTTEIYVTMYYVIYSTRVVDGYIFNP